MIYKKIVLILRTFAITLLFISFFIFTNFFYGYGEEQFSAKSESSLSVQAFRTAEDFFKEANKVASTNPEMAISLYRQGLILKPDAWKERLELGRLYEKQKEWSLAITEYELINKSVGSKESFTDLIRVLDQAGFFGSAAKCARRAFEKYPEEPSFLYLAGELFLKLGVEKEAITVLQEYIKIKPEDGKAFFLLGSIHEKAGRFKDAIYAYLRAEELTKDNREVKDALKRVRARAMMVEGVTIFPPKGWQPYKNVLLNIEGSQRIEVSVGAAGDPATIALNLARKTMPEGLFSDEAIKSYEYFRKVREERLKAKPEMAKEMSSSPIPFLATRDVPGLAGAKMVQISTGDVLYSGIESVVVLAFPSGDKIYTMIWSGNAPIEAGEKALLLIFEQAIWPK